MWEKEASCEGDTNGSNYSNKKNTTKQEHEQTTQHLCETAFIISHI